LRPLWKDILTAVWLGILVPGILLQALVLRERQNLESLPQAARVEQTEPTGRTIGLQNPDGTVEELELEAYLTGVVLAEMPASFHEEALKAQSVAARTYTWKAHTAPVKHINASVCTDPACCQAYLTEEEYLLQGGTEAHLRKVRQAVQATSSMVLTYAGELIEAVYFSASGGETESALAVWGSDFPYLQSVESPGEEESRYHRDTVTFTKEELEKALGQPLSGNAEDWFGPVTYTDGGGVAAMEICGESYPGTRLRSLLNLRSTAFTVEAAEQSVTITTRGYGHRVGLSQYGANAMAEAGSTWQQILQHYYPGTNLVPIS